MAGYVNNMFRREMILAKQAVCKTGYYFDHE